MPYVAAIIDGNNLAHRVSHNHMNLSFNGNDVSVLYGVLRSLCAIYKKHSPQRIIVCFDAGFPAARRKLVPSYKLHRHDGDGESLSHIYEQLDKLYSWLPDFGFVTSKRQGYEADDLIAAWVSHYSVIGQVLVVSGDKDLYQLVGPNVDVRDPMADTLVTVENFEAHTGVLSASYLLYRALVGDKSDGIEGVKNIGPNKAKKIVSHYPTITDLHAGLLSTSAVITKKERDYIKESGGMLNIYNTLNCINLTRYQPIAMDLIQSSIYPSPDNTWRALGPQLMELGFMSIVRDEEFARMVTELNKEVYVTS